MKIVFVALFLAILIAIYIFNQTGKPAPLTRSAPQFVASVNGVAIKKQDFEKKLEEKNKFFEYSKQKISEDTAGKDILEKLIDEKLIENYAKDYKITVSEAEISSRYQIVIENFNKTNNYDTQDDLLFLAKIKEMYGIGKNDYLNSIKWDILKEKVQAEVKMPLSDWLAQQKSVSDIRIN